MFGMDHFTRTECDWWAWHQATVLCKQVVFCHVQTCDETNFNGKSWDFHETVISSFSALFIGLRWPCTFDGPSERVDINLKTHRKVQAMISFSLKFTILPFLYFQAIYHLSTIIYYGTSPHRSHVIFHTLEGNSPNEGKRHAYIGFVPILIHQNKQRWQTFPTPKIINIG